MFLLYFAFIFKRVLKHHLCLISICYIWNFSQTYLHQVLDGWWKNLSFLSFFLCLSSGILVLWFFISLLNNLSNIICSKKILQFDTPIIIGIPFEKWNFEGCWSIARHDYGRISFEDLSYDASLLKNENVVVSFWEGLGRRK